MKNKIIIFLLMTALIFPAGYVYGAEKKSTAEKKSEKAAAADEMKFVTDAEFFDSLYDKLRQMSFRYVASDKDKKAAEIKKHKVHGLIVDFNGVGQRSSYVVFDTGDCAFLTADDNEKRIINIAGKDKNEGIEREWRQILQSFLDIAVRAGNMTIDDNKVFEENVRSITDSAVIENGNQGKINDKAIIFSQKYLKYASKSDIPKTPDYLMINVSFLTDEGIFSFQPSKEAVSKRPWKTFFDKVDSLNGDLREAAKIVVE